MNRLSTIALLAAAAAPLVLAYRAATVDPPQVIAAEPSTAWVAAQLESLPPALADRRRLLTLAILPDGGGIAAGTERRFWRTRDAGRSWSTHEAPVQTPGRLVLRSDGVGLIASWPSWEVYRTADTGWTWTRVQSDVAVMATAILDSLAVVVGWAFIARSSDGGLNWTRIQSPTSGHIYSVALAGHSVIAVGAAGSILRSADGGATWKLLPRPTSAALRSVAFADSATLVAVGTGGTILRSTDGAATWTSVASGTAHHLRAVRFVDNRRGIAVGAYGTILRTSDAGATWLPESSGTIAHLMDAAYTTDDSVVVVGWYDTILRGAGDSAPKVISEDHRP